MARRITCKMVAEKAGVSQTTVSFVLNGTGWDKISPETRERVLRVMRELGYQPNLVARSMRTKRTYTIGIITAGIGGGWFTQIVLGAEQKLRQAGYQILLGSIFPEGKKESLRGPISLLLSRQVDGLIIITGSEEQDVAQLAELSRAGVPAVLVNFFAAKELPFARVYLGYRQAGELAVKHLTSLGRRRIAFVGGPVAGKETTGFLREVYEGYQEGLKKAGISLRQELVWLKEDRRLDFNWGREAAEKLLGLAKLPEAIYCINDYVAYGVLTSLRLAGLEVPEQIAVIGNDNLDASQYVTPSLTSVDMQLGNSGELAADTLLDLLEGRKAGISIRGSVRLIPRASTQGIAN